MLVRKRTVALSGWPLGWLSFDLKELSIIRKRLQGVNILSASSPRYWLELGHVCAIKRPPLPIGISQPNITSNTLLSLQHAKYRTFFRIKTLRPFTMNFSHLFFFFLVFTEKAQQAPPSNLVIETPRFVDKTLLYIWKFLKIGSQLQLKPIFPRLKLSCRASLSTSRAGTDVSAPSNAENPSPQIMQS